MHPCRNQLLLATCERILHTLFFMFYLKTYNFSHEISKFTHNPRRVLDLFQLIPEQNPSQYEVRFATLIIQDRTRVGTHGQPTSG